MQIQVNDPLGYSQSVGYICEGSADGQYTQQLGTKVEDSSYLIQPVITGTTINACKALCDSDHTCRCIDFDTATNDCNLRSLCLSEWLNSDSNFNVFFKAISVSDPVTITQSAGPDCSAGTSTLPLQPSEVVVTTDSCG